MKHEDLFQHRNKLCKCFKPEMSKETKELCKLCKDGGFTIKPCPHYSAPKVDRCRIRGFHGDDCPKCYPPGFPNDPQTIANSGK